MMPSTTTMVAAAGALRVWRATAAAMDSWLAAGG